MQIPTFVSGPGLLVVRKTSRARCPLMSAKESNAGNANDSPRDSSSQQEKPKFKPIRTLKSGATWANTFVEPFERKGSGSDPGWDLRPASLRTDVENIMCDCCKGTGFQICSFCQGGEFQKDGKFVPCPACKGKKKVQCSTCFGTTKQVELVDGWWKKGFASLFKGE